MRPEREYIPSHWFSLQIISAIARILVPCKAQKPIAARLPNLSPPARRKRKNKRYRYSPDAAGKWEEIWGIASFRAPQEMGKAPETKGVMNLSAQG